MPHAASPVSTTEPVSHTDLNSAIRRISDAIAVTTGDLRGQGPTVVFANDVFLELSGYDSPQVLGKPLATLLEHMPPPEVLLPPHTEMGSTTASRTEAVLRHNNGSMLPLEFRSTPLRDRTGNVTHLVLVFCDSVARQHLTCRLEDLASSFTTVRNIVSAGSWISEQGDHQLMRCSKEMLDMFGLTQEEVERDPFMFISRFHPDDRERISRTFRTAMIERKGVDIQHRILLPTGEVRWMHACATPAPAHPNMPFRLVGIVFDITERLATSTSLRAAEQRYRAAAEASLDGLAMFRCRRDWSGSIVDFEFIELNRQAAEFLTRTRDAVIGMGLCELMPGVRTKGYFDKLIAVVESGVAFEAMIPNQSPELKLKWAQIQAVPLADGLALSMRDMSQEKELQVRISQIQRLESTGRISAGIAHDFNNMLSAVIGFGILARDALPDSSEPHKDIVQSIRAAERAAQLTRYLLAFSSRQTLDPQEVDVTRLLQDISAILSRLAGDKIRLLQDILPSQQIVFVDPCQLEQSIVNLVANARDAMPKGGQLKICVESVEVVEGDAEFLQNCIPGKYVRLSITDTGQGMTPYTLERIFEPFYTTKETGSGLGLASVYGFVKQSGGHISVVSEPQQGSTFSIYLPRKPLTQKRTPTPIPRTSEPVARGCETVLLVEGDESAHAAARRILELHGYTVLDATNAGEALLIVEDHPDDIDVLLTALRLPRVDGIDLARRIRKQNSHMAIVLMSGAVERLDIELATEELSAVLLLKPLTPERLVLHVREAIILAQRRGGTQMSEDL